MCKRNAITLVLLFIFTFLFTGSIYAVCTQPICVEDPGLGDILKSGQVVRIDVTVNKTNPSAFQYRLYVRCGTSPWNPQNIITIIPCDYYGRCPDTYWQVPKVPSSKTCWIAADLLDSNFARLGVDVSDAFSIEPAVVSPETLSLTPLSIIVSPNSSANFKVSGGTPPYKVATILHNNIDFSITTIEGNPSILTIPPGDNPFSVENTLSAPCSDTEVVVGVQDATGARAFSVYYIDCP